MALTVDQLCIGELMHLSVDPSIIRNPELVLLKWRLLLDILLDRYIYLSNIDSIWIRWRV